MKLLPRRRRKLTTPDGLQAVGLPSSYAAMLSLYGLRGTFGYLYRSQPNIRSVIEFLATEVASVALKHYEKVPEGPTLPSGRLELADSPLQLLLDHPSPSVTRTRLWFSTVADLHIYDIAFWQKVRLNGELRAVVRVPPSALIPIRDTTTTRILHYNTTLGNSIPLSELVVFEGYDPELQQGNVSPLETLRRVLAEEYAAGRNREHTWRNAARKDGVVERPIDAPEWDAEQRDAWRLEWEGVMSGDTNAARTALLEDGMAWKESTWSPKEMEYLEARKLTRLECAAAFRVDPRLVFATSDPATAEVRTGFYTDRLTPLLTRLQEEIDLQLLPEFDTFDRSMRQYTEFNISEKLRGSFMDEAKIASAAVGGPYVTVNEMRARTNLAPRDGGDELLTPLNSVRGGGPQGSPQAPVDTPGMGPAAGETPGGGTVVPLPSSASLQPLHVHVHTNGNGDGHSNSKAAETPADELKPGIPRAALQRRRDTADKYQQLLVNHFIRQSRTVKSLAGSMKRHGTKVALDTERWNRELARDLFDLTAEVVDDNARRAIAQMNKSSSAKTRYKAYDPERTRAYIDKATQVQAGRINIKTMDDVDGALEEDDPDAAIEHVFDTQQGGSAGGRAAALGTTLATMFINFGRNEGGVQGGGKAKTWVVTSNNSRHPEMDGDTAKMGEQFSNGLTWPGEFSEDPGESAGCQCLMDIEG